MVDRLRECIADRKRRLLFTAGLLFFLAIAATCDFFFFGTHELSKMADIELLHKIAAAAIAGMFWCLFCQAVSEARLMVFLSRLIDESSGKFGRQNREAKQGQVRASEDG